MRYNVKMAPSHELLWVRCAYLILEIPLGGVLVSLAVIETQVFMEPLPRVAEWSSPRNDAK
jgi:hypothetical protein